MDMISSGTILIIDDEINIRQTLKRILEKTGCIVEVVGDGQSAFDVLSKKSIDLVYLDIHLPQMDGMEILRQIRQGYNRLPVIMLTGFGTVDSAVEALRLGANDYLVKPIDPEVLISRTESILQEIAIDRRKAEIHSQIDNLQRELEMLGEGSSDLQNRAILDTNIQSFPDERYFSKGRLFLDLQIGQATLGGTLVPIPPATFEYLVVLAHESPEVVDYQTLVSRVQHYLIGINQAREIAKWHIHVLRRGIKEFSTQQERIINVRGVGYRLILE